MEEEQLSKHERKDHARDQKQQQKTASTIGKLVFWTLVLVLVGLGGYKLYQRYSVPLLGEAMPDQGAEHVTDIYGFEYNSYPPTSGSHFAVWAKRGVYDRVISDGHLIHSLEHGYVVISYDCTKLQISQLPIFQFSMTRMAYAHEEATEGSVLGGGEGVTEEASGSSEASVSGVPLMHLKVGLKGEMDAFTPENAPEAEVELPEAFKSAVCVGLRENLAKFYDQNKSKRLIVVPRVGMETPVALTAWNRIIKLVVWDEQQAKTFLSQWENKGPEKTVE